MKGDATMTISPIFAKVRAGEDLTQDEIIFLLSITDSEEKEKIFNLAEELTIKYLGPEIHLRGIIEFSNYCSRNCNYCGLRLDNSKLVRYRMQPEEIVECAEKIADLGLKTVVLQSGEDFWYTKDMIRDIISEIKKRTDLAITLSLGERKYEELKVWREAGADRYLLKQETVNQSIFAEIKPDSVYEERFGILKQLADLGYQVGSGGMIGLPGQTVSDLADDLIYIRENPVGMAGFGPFISHGDTPYSSLSNGDGELALLLLAVARIVLKKVFLPATTALETLVVDGRKKAIKAGANVIMPNMTPINYRKLYEIYPNKAQTTLDEVVDLIKSIGRVVGKGHGNTLI